MREKAQLKLRYKELIRDGKVDEAQKVLEQIWNFNGFVKNANPEVKKQKPSKVVKPEVKKKEKESNELDRLIKIKGIGKETLSDIKRKYHSLTQLKMDLKRDKCPLRNDIVRILKEVLNDSI